MSVTRARLVLIAPCIAAGSAAMVSFGGCSSGDLPLRSEVTGETTQATQVSGWGYYCSAVNPSTRGWSLWTGDLDFNPCSQEAASGETTLSAGLFSTTGPNTVVVNCDQNYYWIYQGYGQNPITWAYNAANGPPRPGGCVFRVTPAPNWTLPPTPPGVSASGCASGYLSQDFGLLPDGVHHLVGCAGRVTWDQRAALCGYGWGVAAAADWNATGPSVAPTHDYWTNDTLGYGSSGSSGNCLASSAIDGSTVLSCGANTPMRVCTPSGTDGEGNSCTWTRCGLNAVSPNAYLGGCVVNATAGALCKQDVPVPNPPSPPASSLTFDVNKFATGVSSSLANLIDQTVAMGYQLAVHDNNGNPVWWTANYYAGYDSSHNWLPMSNDRRFDVASMSKTITAIAVTAALEDLQTHQAGITLDSSIGPFLPSNWSRPASVNNITFRDVLLHTTGLPENSGNVGDPFAPFPGGSPQNLYTALQADIATGPCTNLPCPASGQVLLGLPRYSNAGYALLRIVLPYLVDCPAGASNQTCVYAPYEGDAVTMANLTAQSYRNYVKNRVLDPVGLGTVDVNWAPATYSTTPSQYVAPRSSGALPPDSRSEDLSPAGRLHQEETAGPGCWNISALEYGKLVSSLRLGKIVSSASYAKMAAYEYIPDVRVGMYGSTTNEGTALSHNGGGGSSYGPSTRWMTFPNGYTVTFIADTALSTGPVLETLFNNALRYPNPPSAPVTWTTVTGAATAIGSGWSISTNAAGGGYLIYYWNPPTGLWAQVGGAAMTISVDLTGTPWVVNSAGQIFKWDGAAFQAFGGVNTLCATQVASGSTDTETWALRCGDGAILHWNGSAWAQVSGAGHAIAVFSSPDPTCGDHLPVVLGGGNGIYFYRHAGGCSSGGFSYLNGAGYDLSTDFVVGTDGNIYHWNASASSWGSPWTAAPWGVNTKIGAWAQGFFAIDSVSHNIQRIVQQ